ncbi:hypothetical protein ACHQM5_022156 [Ranunculus cassubicifolius]
MDWGDFSEGAGDGRPSPRKELQIQGPRPTPLKVRKDSHKIKKPPIAPPYHPQHHQQQQSQSQYQYPPPQQQQQQQRQPVIIYTVSPKVIHTDASEFMSLVQRLTGSNSSSSPTVSASNSGAISPAARYATIEKTKMPLEGDKSRFFDSMDTIIGDIEIGPNVERTGSFPGILSPMPSSLPIVSPNFFSPPSDQNSFNFLHDLSPMFQGNKNYFETAFMPSPNNSSFLSTPTAITSPNLSFDLFNQFLDF